MSTVYENIKALCAERGISGAKLCIGAGISKSTLTSLSKGRTKSISAENAQKFADYLGVSVDRILNGKEDIKKEPTLQEKDEFREIYAGLTEENKAKALEYAALLLNSQHRS